MAYSGYTDVYVTDFNTLSFAWSQQSQSIEKNTEDCSGVNEFNPPKSPLRYFFTKIEDSLS